MLQIFCVANRSALLQAKKQPYILKTSVLHYLQHICNTLFRNVWNTKKLLKMPTFEDFIVNLQSKDSHHEKSNIFNLTINHHLRRLQTKQHPDATTDRD